MSQLLVEVRPGSSAGDLGARPRVPEEFSRRASEIADSVATVAEDFRARLEQRVEEPTARTDPWRLEQVELAFALELQAESGVVIARASAGATFTATLTWQRLGREAS